MQYKVLIIFYNLTFIHNPHDYSPNIAPYPKKSAPTNLPVLTLFG